VEQAESNPVIAVVLEDLQAGSLTAVLEDGALLLGLPEGDRSAPMA
jgi:hypothetical protein